MFDFHWYCRLKKGLSNLYFLTAVSQILVSANKLLQFTQAIALFVHFRPNAVHNDTFITDYNLPRTNGHV